MPLRWLAQVLLLAYIFGLFGFLEYEIRALPMPDVEAIDIPEAADATITSQGAAQTGHHLVTPRHSMNQIGAISEATASSSAAVLGTTQQYEPTIRTPMAMTSMPMPVARNVESQGRKSESDYPHGGNEFATRLAWAPPKTEESRNLVIEMIDGEFCFVDTLIITEWIPTQYSSDESWCLVYPGIRRTIVLPELTLTMTPLGTSLGSYPVPVMRWTRAAS